MNDEGEWTDWIEHDGMGCPVSVGTFVNVVRRNGAEQTIAALCFRGDDFVGPLSDCPTASTWSWALPLNFTRADRHIIRYRIRRPRALLDLIDLAESLPAPVTPERVDA